MPALLTKAARGQICLVIFLRFLSGLNFESGRPYPTSPLAGTLERQGLLPRFPGAK